MQRAMLGSTKILIYIYGLIHIYTFLYDSYIHRIVTLQITPSIFFYIMFCGGKKSKCQSFNIKQLSVTNHCTSYMNISKWNNRNNCVKWLCVKLSKPSSHVHSTPLVEQYCSKKKKHQYCCGNSTTSIVLQSKPYLCESMNGPCFTTLYCFNWINNRVLKGRYVVILNFNNYNINEVVIRIFLSFHNWINKLFV